MRLHLVTLFALAGAAFGGNSYKAPAPAPAPYRPPVYQNNGSRNYVSPGSRSTTGVQPRNSIPYGSRSTTGVQPRGVQPRANSIVPRTVTTGPRAQTTISSQRNQLANSTNKSNVVRFPSPTQKQNVNNRLAKLQTGGAANQNTPKPSNDNTKPAAQARLASLSNHFNTKASTNNGSGNGGPNGTGTGSGAGGGGTGGSHNGGNGKDGGGSEPPQRKPVSLIKNKNIASNTTGSPGPNHDRSTSTAARNIKVGGVAGIDKPVSNVRKDFENAHNNVKPKDNHTATTGGNGTPNRDGLHEGKTGDGLIVETPSKPPKGHDPNKP